MEFIKNVPLFNGINNDELLKLLHCIHSTVRNYKKSSVVFHEGEKADFIGILLTGSVIISRNDYYGNRSIISTISSPHIFAEAFACSGTEAIPVCVTAQEDSIILFISCKKLLNSCNDKCGCHNRLIQNLIRILSNKNIILNQKLEVMSKRTTKEKIMAYLLNEAKKAGSNSFSIPYDRQALADYLGVERSAMSAEIGKLKRAGIIEVNKRWFKISELTKEHSFGSKN